MTPGPILIVSGPPAAGKTTLCRFLASQVPFGIHIPVDDLREWVLGGISHPIPDWNEETARQFLLAEGGAADLAKRYSAAGFTVVLDHCRLPENIEAWVDREFQEAAPIKVAVLPEVETILCRNSLRTDKPFDPAILEPAILGIHAAYRAADLSDWTVIQNRRTPAEEVQTLSSLL